MQQWEQQAPLHRKCVVYLPCTRWCQQRVRHATHTQSVGSYCVYPVSCATILWWCFSLCTHNLTPYFLHLVLPRQGCTEGASNTTGDMSSLWVLVARGLPEVLHKSPQWRVCRSTCAMSLVRTECVSERVTDPRGSLSQQACYLSSLPNGGLCHPVGGDWSHKGLNPCLPACCFWLLWA